VVTLMVVLAGCASHTAPPAPSPPATTTSAPPAPVAAAPPPPATFAEAGLYGSECAYRSATFLYKHEWAAGLVPPEYRQVNVQAGNTGENSLQMFSCAAVAIGNQTFLPGVGFGLYAVRVAAPEGMQAATRGYYLLDFLTDNAALAGAMADARLPAKPGLFSLAETSHGMESADPDAAFAASVAEPHHWEAAENGTWLARLHWKVGAAHCWVDVEAASRDSVTTEAVLTGTAGSAATLTGPLHRLAGLGSHGVEGLHMGPPRCLDA
jgi:hypothetical protein